MRQNIYSLVAVLLMSSPAFAVLGESRESIQEDATALGLQSGVQKLDSSGNYTTHDLIRPSGAIRMREYVANSSGKVFALAWTGIRNPDIKQILGQKYHNEYLILSAKTQIPKSKQIYRKSFNTIESPNFVLKRGGHMRSLHGVAYDPSLFPEGFKAENIFWPN